MTDRTFYTQFAGYWCDNCEIARKGVGLCPDCGEEMRPARITVEPSDLDDEPSPNVVRRRKDVT